MPGSIEWRSPTSCRISIPDGYMDGKKKWIRETMTFTNGETKAQMQRLAEARKAELYVQAKRGELVSGRQFTLKEFGEMWLREYAPTEGLSPVTVEGYQQLLTGRIYPNLGHVKLHQLTAPMLTNFYRKLLSETGKGYRGGGKKLSASTVLHYHRLLRSMLNTAVRWGIIPQNPALKATTPKSDAKKMKAYDPQQAGIMLEALSREPKIFQAGVLLALLGQMRKGEIAGADWTGLDLSTNTLRIERSAVYLPRQGTIIKPPKTESGRRTIALPQQVIAALKMWKAEQNQQRLRLGESWADSGAIFTQWDGKRQHPDTLSKWFHGFLLKNSFPPIRFHDLRHTGASILMNIMGEPVQIVADRLGHSSPSVTLAFYSHGYQQKDRSAADGLEALLNPKTGVK